MSTEAHQQYPAKQPVPFATTYELTPAEEKAVARQYFKHIHWPRTAITLVLLLVMALLICGGRNPIWTWVGGFFFGYTGLLLVSLGAQWRQINRITRTPAEQKRDGRVEVQIDDTEITYKSDRSNSHFNWVVFEKVIETRDFLILVSRGLPCIPLPKRCYSAPEQLLIKSMCARNVRERSWVCPKCGFIEAEPSRVCTKCYWIQPIAEPSAPPPR